MSEAPPGVQRGLSAGPVGIAGALGQLWGPVGSSGCHVTASAFRLLNPKPQDSGCHVGAKAQMRDCGEDKESRESKLDGQLRTPICSSGKRDGVILPPVYPSVAEAFVCQPFGTSTSAPEPLSLVPLLLWPRLYL